MSDTANDTTPRIETRIIFTDTGTENIQRATEQLQEWLQDGFVVVTETCGGGNMYIRLERDNAAIAEEKRWDALTPAEKIGENVRGLTL